MADWLSLLILRHANSASNWRRAIALRGWGSRLSVRAVKAARLAFIEAEQAGGSGAGFSQEGQNEIENSYVCVFIRSGSRHLW
jgi:hypothetical protein